MTEWDEYAATWDDDVAVGVYATAAFESLSAEAERRGFEIGGSMVLDFGCGTGQLTERLVATARSIDAVDVSSAMLEVLDAKIVRNGWTNVRSLAAIDRDQPAYDLIVCSSVCSFLGDYPATVIQLASLLRTGGLFAQWDWELDPSDPNSHGLTRDEIRRALDAAGLDFVTVETAFEVAVDEQEMRPLLGVGRRGKVSG
jgi:predicted TPR repeat methyltransferase